MSTWTLLKRRPSRALQGEVWLQRQIVSAVQDGWWAEVPCVSGFNVTGPKRQSIDLIQRLAVDAYRFFELKSVERTNNPIFAGVEMIKYALFYARIRTDLHARSCLSAASCAVMNARRIQWSVVAPTAYYRVAFPLGFDPLSSLSRSISAAFRSLGEHVGAEMSFEFRTFEIATADSFFMNRPLS